MSGQVIGPILNGKGHYFGSPREHHRRKPDSLNATRGDPIWQRLSFQSGNGEFRNQAAAGDTSRTVVFKIVHRLASTVAHSILRRLHTARRTKAQYLLYGGRLRLQPSGRLK